MLIRGYNQFLQDGYQNKFFNVVKIDWAYSPDDILKLRDQYIQAGYEGAIIRKRSPQSREAFEKHISW